MLASVAYATDDMTSLEKTASAFHFGSRCSISSAEAIGCPRMARRAVKALEGDAGSVELGAIEDPRGRRVRRGQGVEVLLIRLP